MWNLIARSHLETAPPPPLHTLIGSGFVPCRPGTVLSLDLEYCRSPVHLAKMFVKPKPNTGIGEFIICISCRYLGFLEKEILRADIRILDTGENPEAPAPREMIDLEVG